MKKFFKNNCWNDKNIRWIRPLNSLRMKNFITVKFKIHILIGATDKTYRRHAWERSEVRCSYQMAMRISVGDWKCDKNAVWYFQLFEHIGVHSLHIGVFRGDFKPSRFHGLFKLIFIYCPLISYGPIMTRASCCYLLLHIN